MTEERDPFELEPETAPAAGAPPPRAPGPAPPPRDATYEERLRERAAEREGEEVGERTVAERLGRAAARGHEPLPPPPGWPGEVWRFPLKAPGPLLAAVAITLWSVLDCLGAIPDMRFFAWVLKLFTYVVLFRAQVCIAGQSAAGRDEPVGWFKALEVRGEDAVRLLGVLTHMAVAAAPGLVLLLADAAPAAFVLFALASLYGVVVALGWALSDPTLRRPWNALAWIVSRPLHCLGVAATWWLIGVGELAIRAVQSDGVILTAFVSLLVRGLCAWLLLVGARVLGVMGRAWTTA